VIHKYLYDKKFEYLHYGSSQRCPSRLKTDRCRTAVKEAKYLQRRCRTALKISSTAAAPHRDGYFRKSTAAAMGFRKIF
jgi:hypothetical protein